MTGSQDGMGRAERLEKTGFFMVNKFLIIYFFKNKREGDHIVKLLRFPKGIIKIES